MTASRLAGSGAQPWVQGPPRGEASPVSGDVQWVGPADCDVLVIGGGPAWLTAAAPWPAG